VAVGMNRISTHILDLMRGTPAKGVPVRLERQDASGSWQLLNSSHTDQNGRCAQLLPGGQLQSGVYKLLFDTAAYFGALQISALYPVVEVTFRVRDGESQFHIPLLLNANGYTTYRGT
jgi:5-hydroxyisourate hydrolase